jgi:PTH1 family peptidyl-tRNA hydrolase
MIYTDMKFVRDKTVMGFVASREGLVLVQPTTFMNLNGKTVLRAMRKFDVDAQDVTVVHDDVETALGKIGVRLGGGARYTSSQHLCTHTRTHTLMLRSLAS